MSGVTAESTLVRGDKVPSAIRTWICGLGIPERQTFPLDYEGCPQKGSISSFDDIDEVDDQKKMKSIPHIYRIMSFHSFILH
jgi:hypothetical protein